MAGIPDPYITLHNPTVDYDSIGTYSTQDAGRVYTGELFTAWEKPFYITVAPDCPNDYIFTLNVTMSCTNGMDPEDTAEYVTQGTVTLRVRSGKVLPSVISEDMTLTSDNLYIIPSGTVITKGTTDDRAIGLQIVDYSDFPAAYSLLNYKPVLETAPENTFPFVTDLTIFNKDGEEVTTVSNEEITVRITFNRDMDTSIPLLVQYGSAPPSGITPSRANLWTSGPGRAGSC